MHAKPDLRVFLKWMIAGSGSVITAVIRFGESCPMKWSLRSLFALVTVVSILIALKYNERNRVVSATRVIQDLGGEVIYRRENPVISKKQEVFRAAYGAKPRATTRTLPDGTSETVYVTSTWQATMPFPSTLNFLSRAGTTNQKNRMLEFLGNYDVAVDAVRIRDSLVDSDLIDQLMKLNGLKIVLICRDRSYYQTSVSQPKWHYVTDEEKSSRMIELGKPFEDAKSLIHKHLPNLQVVDGLWD